jgi:hypothetical protein
MAKIPGTSRERKQRPTAVGGGLEMAIRQRPRMLIDAIVKEELEIALGAAPSVWVGEARVQRIEEGSRMAKQRAYSGPLGHRRGGGVITYPAWRVVRPSIALRRRVSFWATCGVTSSSRNCATNSRVS